jgi:hypothetical protein
MLIEFLSSAVDDIEQDFRQRDEAGRGHLKWLLLSDFGAA